MNLPAHGGGWQRGARVSRPRVGLLLPPADLSHHRGAPGRVSGHPVSLPTRQTVTILGDAERSPSDAIRTVDPAPACVGARKAGREGLGGPSCGPRRRSSAARPALAPTAQAGPAAGRSRVHPRSGRAVPSGLALGSSHPKRGTTADGAGARDGRSLVATPITTVTGERRGEYGGNRPPRPNRHRPHHEQRVANHPAGLRTVTPSVGCGDHSFSRVSLTPQHRAVQPHIASAAQPGPQLLWADSPTPRSRTMPLRQSGVPQHAPGASFPLPAGAPGLHTAGGVR